MPTFQNIIRYYLFSYLVNFDKLFKVRLLYDSSMVMKSDYTPTCPVWEITLKCNLKCKHCGSSAGIARLNELSTLQAITICEELAEIGTLGVALMGGEVFLRNDWYEISKRIKDLGMQLSIVTNGYVNPDKIIPKLKKLEVDSLSMGLDGLKKTHNVIRGKSDAFEKTIHFIDECAKAGLDPCPITTFHKINLNEFHQVKELIMGKDLDWHILSALLIGRFEEKFHLSKEEHYGLGLMIASAQKEYSSDRIFPGHILGFHQEYFPDITPYQKWHGCYAGKTMIGLRSNGGVLGCETLPDDFLEGTINESSLKEIWESSDSFKYNRKFKESDLGGYCKICKYGKSCKGGCTSRSYTLTGQPHNDPYCFYRVEQEVFGENINKKVEELSKKYKVTL
jgi:radical SAM protein with 4Fe4S-binding SPASM domain